MPQQGRAIILSDLHMGPDNHLCSFRDERSLAALLSRLADEADAPPTELVLAGDLFDFLQVEGYGGFDAGLSVQRFDEILRSPRTTVVIEALRRLARRPDVEVTVLAGNHDPELLVPSVRERFEDAMHSDAARPHRRWSRSPSSYWESGRGKLRRKTATPPRRRPRSGGRSGLDHDAPCEVGQRSFGRPDDPA